jgi:DNA-binding IclR family transcriptional regulator
MTDKSSAPVNASAAHVFDILRHISRASAPLGVAEIGRQLDLPTTTVHRALVTLEQTEFAARMQTAPRYELGPMPQYLARALFRRLPLRAAATPYLAAIAKATGETTSLGLRLGWHQVRVAIAYGGNDLHSPGRLGAVHLLHRGAASRIILAFLTPHERTRYRRFLLRHHPSLLGETTSQPSRRSLIETRRRGVAGEGIEAGAGRYALAFPVRGPDGAAVASIFVNGPVASGAPQALARPGWARPVDDLEAMIRAKPEILAHPYAHLDPDAILFDLRRQEDATGAWLPSL